MRFLLVLVIILISSIFSEVSCDCTEGFMDYDLLEQKASQIGTENAAATLSSNTLSVDAERYYVMPSLKFSCSGTISGFRLGVNVKIASENRDMFPNVTLYSFESSMGQRITYSRVLGSSRMIQLEANVFSSSGVYEYQLSNHLNFNKDNVLGIYQPPSEQSVVELFYQPRPEAENEDIFIVSNENQVTIQTMASDSDRKENRRVLLHPITNDQSCISGFIPDDEIRTEAKKITLVDDAYSGTERLYKGIKFTCEGYITHVIIGTMDLPSNSNPPEIRLWRRTNGTGYERTGQSMQLAYDDATQDVSTPYLRWYNLSSPISVQEGDFLGIYNYLPKDQADCLIYYQKYNGPINYSPDLSETGDNNYPLVSVIYSNETGTIPMPTSSSRTKTLGGSVYTSSQAMTSSVIIENTTSESSAGVIAGSVITVIVLIVLVIILGAVFALLWWRKNKKSKDVRLPDTDDSIGGLTNMVYGGLPINDGEPGLKMDAGPLSNPVYEVNGTKEMIEPTDYEVMVSSIKDSNNHYEVANSVKFTDPMTLSYPRYISHNTDPSYSSVDEPFSGMETIERNFMGEEPIYWEPESNTEGIYQQLTGREFREIPREMISVSEQIGSGHFGTVHKGTWNTVKGLREVAIKTLKTSASEEEEVRFLQEAAINGQFHHRNVVKLCGVVTVGHPIMIVLEFATNGDLREFLINMRPVPGELPDDSFPAVLNDFSYHVASGMKYLARKKFVHRDLAARNVLVGDGKVCKIADFGMSIELQDENYYTSHINKIPLKWTAPEAISFRRYSSQSDVWSFGIVLYEIWSVGHKPFEQHTNQEYIDLIESGHRLRPPPGCPEIIYKMMIQCWHPDASSRPTFDDLQSMLEDSESITSEINLNAFIKTADADSDVQKIYK